MSTKKRDLAQELVAFLIKEDGQKKSTSARKSEVPNLERSIHLVDEGNTHKVSILEIEKNFVPESAPSNQNENQPTMALVNDRTINLADDAFEFGPATGAGSIHTKALQILKEISPKYLDKASDSSSPNTDDTVAQAMPPEVGASAPEPAPESANSTAERLSDQRSEPSAEQRSEPQAENRSVAEPSAEAGASIPKKVKNSQGLPSQRANIVFNEVSALVAGAEAVKVAQARISTLEKDNDSLRNEIEQVLTSSESVQRRFNELRSQHENLERKHREKIEILEDEKAVLRTRLSAKEEELVALRRENDDLKSRFQTDLRKIRVRERELEHRQEIIKAEMVSVVRGKDEVILELKNQLEKLSFELDNFKSKSADMTVRMAEFHERNHRTIKALRLALNVLDSGDSDDKPKKAG